MANCEGAQLQTEAHGPCDGLAELTQPACDVRPAATMVILAPAHASFDAKPTAGVAPLEVTYSNLSYGDYDSSLWRFGDGVTSTLESPTHTYTVTGVYTVTLAVSGPGGSDTERKVDYVRVGVPDTYNLYVPLILHSG